MPNHILWVTSNPASPERDEEYNYWYNSFHIQQALKLPEFVAVTRYKLSHMQMEWFPPSAADPVWPYGKDQYLAIYELSDGVSVDAAIVSLAASERQRRSMDPDNDPIVWGEQRFYESFTQREASVWLRPGGPAPSKPDEEPNHIFVVPISPLTPELEDDFNKWYISQGNIRRKGISAGVRYRLATAQGSIDYRAPMLSGEWPFGQHNYLMIYELHDPLTAKEELRPARPMAAPPS